jgi:hypothetical protein
MKKNMIILACLIACSAAGMNVSAQTKQTPDLGKEILHDKEPAVVKQIAPVYPPSMLESGWEATVYLKAFIDVEGNVAESQSIRVQIISTKSPDKSDVPAEQTTEGKAFVEASITALKQWKFTPAQMKGKPVGAWVTVPFRFKLSGEGKRAEGETDRAEREKSIESIKTVIENILKGTELEKVKKSVGTTASLIYNTKMVNLYSVLNGEQKDIRLTEGKDAQCVNFNMNIADDGGSVLIVWTSEQPKGRNKRIHTILLVKNAAKEWKITHWHVSF